VARSLDLIERLPKRAEVFGDGDVDQLMVRAALFGTGLITDQDVLVVGATQKCSTVVDTPPCSQVTLVPVEPWPSSVR
jgi:hypothetical protein